MNSRDKNDPNASNLRSVSSILTLLLVPFIFLHLSLTWLLDLVFISFRLKPQLQEAPDSKLRAVILTPRCNQGGFTGLRLPSETDVVAHVWGWVWGGPCARLLRLVAFASALDQLSPCSPLACPGFVSDCHQSLLPFRCCWLVSEFYSLTWPSLDFTFAFEPFGFGRLAGFWPDTWVEHLPLRITDLILPFLSTSYAHLLLCCVVKSILR